MEKSDASSFNDGDKSDDSVCYIYGFKENALKLPKKRELKPEEHPEYKEEKSGIIYFQTIPPFFTVARMRQEMSQYGEVGRIYLQAEKRRDLRGKRHKRYTEGWVEFKNKRLAKRIAASLNNTAVGGKRRSAAREFLWAMKYLSGFKWCHLMDQLTYEKKVEQQRMRAEIAQAKRQADFFAEQVEKGEKLKRLEEKVLKKGGVWEKYQRQVQQRKTVKETDKVTNSAASDDRLLQMIFTE
uniref:Activator of basal transcription 1 n=1 Tax=Syphacia muris TaxID=451379 RepID=A0A158R4V4_9BILA